MGSLAVKRVNFCLLAPALIVLLLQIFSWPNHALANSSTIPAAPPIQLIPGATKSWIAARSLQNGVPTSILQFSYPGTKAEIESFYKKKRLKKPIYIKNTAQLLIVAYEENAYFYSISAIQQNTGVQPLINGKIVVSKLSTKAKQLTHHTTRLPLLPGSDIISRTESADGEIMTETLMIQNQHSKEANYRYFKQQLEKLGWYKSNEESVRNMAASQKISYEQGEQSMQITLFPLQKTTSGRTGILVHWQK